VQKQADGRPLAQGRWCQSGDVRERPQVARWGSSSGCCRGSLQRREGGGGAAVCSRQPDRQRLRQAAPPPPRIATPAARHPPPWAAQGRGARGHTVAAAKNCSTDAPNRPPARRRRLAAPPPLSTRVMTAGHDRPHAQRTTPVTVGVRVRRAPPIRQPGRPLPPRVVREGGGRRHATCGGRRSCDTTPTYAAHWRWGARGPTTAGAGPPRPGISISLHRAAGHRVATASTHNGAGGDAINPGRWSSLDVATRVGETIGQAAPPLDTDGHAATASTSARSGLVAAHDARLRSPHSPNVAAQCRDWFRCWWRSTNRSWAARTCERRFRGAFGSV